MPTNSNTQSLSPSYVGAAVSSVRTPETRRPSSAHKAVRPHSCTTVQRVPPLLLMPSPYPAARIAVDDSTWRAFRQAAIVRGIPVSVYLGKLVDTELGRRNATAIADVTPGVAPGNQALVALSAVRVSIDELDDIAGRLARSANRLGGSWQDIASSLRLTEDAARRAYDRPPAR